jgi:hypothetical protein
MDASRLKQRIAKVEALLSGATTPGERNAAHKARERLRARLEDLQQRSVVEPFQFSVEDPYSRALLVALARRHGLKPYRKRGQHRRTIMVDAPEAFVREVLFPEFKALSDALHEELSARTTAIIKAAVHGDVSDADERGPRGALPPPRDG